MTSKTVKKDQTSKINWIKRDNNNFEVKSPYDGLRLVGNFWPVTEPRAIILFVHGSGEHSGRYKHVVKFFNEHKITCVTYDLRGHGLSGGERGFAPSMDALFDDLECIVKCIRNEPSLTKPLIIYAHGTGCSICIAHILKRPDKLLDYQYLILSTPSICLKTRPTAILFFIARAFSNLSPHLRLPLEGNMQNVYTNDENMVKLYREDPLVHDRWPARSVCVFLELGYLLETTPVRFVVPVLVQHGMNDTITPYQTIEKWKNERTTGNDIELKLWPEHMHELHNDLGRLNVLNYGLNWIVKHLDSTESSWQK